MALSSALESEVIAICREVLEDPGITIESTSATVKKWDSLGHMQLIAALEARYAVEFDVLEMAEVDCVEMLIGVVRNALRSARGAVGGGS
jgi:acyl carrier protein